tara:strand:+ start:257 stop:3610 length:3354 start_codon:yes stop_codon:yes gene_type:complete
MFSEYKKLDLVKVCSEVNSFWKQKNIFQKSISSKSSNNRFVFFEGPPSANGLPGIHHVMARLIKDIFCRYKTLRGFRVDRKAGWDTHGLPVELSVEKQLGISKEDIGKNISISKYNEECKKTVMRYTRSWNELTEKMGYWVDTNTAYITYKNKYIESVWFLVKRLFNKKLLYRGYTIQPYSPAAGTGLSSHELNQPGCYKQVKDLSVFALFKVIKPKFKTSLDVYFVAWTTTPWTLFANTGLAVGKNINYLYVQTTNPFTSKPMVIICAEDCLDKIFDEKTNRLILKNSDKNYSILSKCKGLDLVGLRYDQLLKNVQPEGNGGEAFRVIEADFVTTESGTGIVHLAPTFGADDFNVAKKNNLPPMLIKSKNKPDSLVPIVDERGRFVSELGEEFGGRFVKSEFSSSENHPSVDVDIVVMLKKMGLAFKSEKYTHSYPHCWRTDKPILYYPLNSWFIKTTDFKAKLVEKNKEINWKPQSTGEGRFQNWLENLNDWNVSRSRFWGIPIPLWKSEDGSEVLCVGSVEELKLECEKSFLSGNMDSNPLKDFVPGDMSEANYDIFDLHKNVVDKIVLTSKSGLKMFRDPDVLDVWFDSGSMPYAQWHYPFENKELIDSGDFFPADFIAEGVDQTRGWFFTLHAIGVMCFDSVAFKNVISNGLVLDSLGQKMSKRLGNSVDPFDVFTKHGADTIRWYMITNAQPWDNLKFNLDGVVEVKQKLFSTLHNVYSFFALYANIDGFVFNEDPIPVSKRHLLDRWIISETNSLIKSVGDYYNDYEPTLAGRQIQFFVVEKLSNWYIRLCRRRFWKGEYDQEKISAYQTLFECLVNVSKIASPIAPFFMDRLFLDLNNVANKDSAQSVHLSDFPPFQEDCFFSDLEKNMRITKGICSLALSIRKKQGIRVRQPLKSIDVCLQSGGCLDPVFIDIIKSEINVKSVLFSEAADGSVKRNLVVNFPVLGKRAGAIMKDVLGVVRDFGEKECDQYIKNGTISAKVGEQDFVFLPNDLLVKIVEKPGLSTAKNENALIVLNTSLNEELLAEGLSREVVNRIQNTRKENNLDVMNKINIFVSGDEKSIAPLIKHKNYILEEVLGVELVVSKAPLKNSSLFEFKDYKMYIAIQLCQ